MLYFNQTTDTDHLQRCNYITVLIFQNSSSLILKLCGPHETEMGDDMQNLMSRRVTFYTLFGYRAKSKCDEEGNVGEKVARNEIREKDGEWGKRWEEGEGRVLKKTDEKVAMGGKKDKKSWKKRKQKWKTIQEDNKEMKSNWRTVYRGKNSKVPLRRLGNNKNLRFETGGLTTKHFKQKLLRDNSI